MIEKSKNMEKYKTKYDKDLIIAEFLDYLKKASSSLSIKKKKAVLNLLYSTNIMNEADIDKILSYFNLGIKNKEEFLAESENYDIIFDYDSLSPDLQDWFLNIEASEKRRVFVEIKNHIAKVKDEKLHYLPLPLSNKNDTDLSGAPRDDIIKICNILVEIKNEIKRTNKMVISLESFVRKISLESNIIKMEEKTISQKIKGLEAGIEHLSDLSTDIYKTLLKTPSISTKEAQSIGLSTPYIISLSLSTAVFVFCGVSLYVNIFMAKTLFDPYLSLFWFLGGLGIGLMSLKGIFSWGKNEKK